MKKTLFILTSVTLVMLACSDPDDYTVTPGLLTNAVKFLTENQSIAADGYQTLTIEAILLEGTKEGKRDVTFTTSAGTFVGDGKNTVTIKAVPLSRDEKIQLIASAKLKSSVRPETAVVSAKAGDFTAKNLLNVTFTPALPTGVNLSASAFTVKAPLASEITLTAKFTKDAGLPTAGMKVEFWVTKPDGTTLGSVVYRSKNQSSDESGAATAVFAVADTMYLGKAIAKVKVSNTSVRDSLFIFVVK